MMRIEAERQKAQLTNRSNRQSKIGNDLIGTAARAGRTDGSRVGVQVKQTTTSEVP